MITVIHRCEDINDSYHNVVTLIGTIFHNERRYEKYTQLRYVFRISFMLSILFTKWTQS